jgi:uncharacterized protein
MNTRKNLKVRFTDRSCEDVATTQTKRVVLLFARSPETEARCKRLSHRLSHARLVRLYESLTLHLLREASRISLPVVVATDNAVSFPFRSPAHDVLVQTGTSFGARLRSAISWAFALGYDEVVCVGNDSPLLTAKDLRGACERLSKAGVVLGKAADGGLYLIGVRRSACRPLLNSFEHCRWRSSMVFADLDAATRELHVAVSVLPTISDIDSDRDLLNASATLPWLRSFIHVLVPPSPCARGFVPPILSSQITPRLRQQKAPPCLFA